MGSDDWYRSTSWSEERREAFLSRLKRARSQRDQYIVIQAAVLVATHPDASLELVDLYFSSRTDSFHDVRALNVRAQSKLQLGDTYGALKAYKEVLALEGASPGFKTNAFVEYPLLVATERVRAEFSTAMSVLIERAADCAFPVQRFMWHGAYALILMETSALEEAKLHARKSLEAASAKASPFRYHRDLGLVGPAHARTVELLEAIAAEETNAR